MHVTTRNLLSSWLRADYYGELALLLAITKKACRKLKLLSFTSSRTFHSCNDLTYSRNLHCKRRLVPGAIVCSRPKTSAFDLSCFRSHIGRRDRQSCLVVFVLCLNLIHDIEKTQTERYQVPRENPKATRIRAIQPIEQNRLR